MKTFATTLRRFVNRLSDTVFLGGVIVMGAMTLHITVDVIARYLFNAALPGTIAFVQNYYMIAVTFLPLAVAEIQRKHIEVEVVADQLPLAVQAFLRLVAWIMASVALLVLTWVSSTQAWDAFKVGVFIVEQDAKIYTWMSYFMLPIGFLSSALICLARVLITFLGLANGLTSSVFVAERFFDDERGTENRDV